MEKQMKMVRVNFLIPEAEAKALRYILKKKDKITMSEYLRKVSASKIKRDQHVLDKKL